MKEGKFLKEVERDGLLYRFRHARWQDAPAYIEMCNILHVEQVMAYHAKTDFDLGMERLSKFLLGLETGRSSHVVIEADGRLLGEGAITTGAAPGTGTLGIKIIGACRGRGLGEEMMYQLEDEAKGLGLRRIYLVVWGLNEPAYRLYCKVGYREVGRLPEWFSKEDEAGNTTLSDRVEMIKDLQ